MKLAISNIAWAPEQRMEAYAEMAAHGFTGLEVAPSLAFAGEADPFAPSAIALTDFRAELEQFGLTLVSAQSLLFGVEDAQLFGNAGQQARFEQGMARAIRFAGVAGVPNLVFGSPACRAYGQDWSALRAWDHAAAMFQRIGDLAHSVGTRVAIEPNATVYGTNFLNTLTEAIAFVRAVDHSAITLNFDIGALIAADEPEGVVVAEAAPLASHVHISEPGLSCAPANEEELTKLAAALLSQGYAEWFSIEMRLRPDDWQADLTRSLAATARALSAAESYHA